MSPKQRFQVLLEPEQLSALREIELRTGASIGEQIRRAIDQRLGNQKKAERKRAVTRKRP
jgi:hypothetical protein